MHMAPQGVHLREFRRIGSSSTPSVCPVGAREGRAPEWVPSPRIAAGPGFSAVPNLALPLNCVPAGGHAVPRGGTNTSHAARRPLGRSGASTCRSRSPSLGSGEESQASLPPALLAPLPFSVCGGGTRGGRLCFQRPPLAQEVAQSTGAAVLAGRRLAASCLGCPWVIQAASWRPGSRASSVRVSAGSLGGDRGEPLTTHHPDGPDSARLARGIPTSCLQLSGCEVPEGPEGAPFPGQWLLGGAATQSRVFTRRGAGALEGGLSWVRGQEYN